MRLFSKNMYNRINWDARMIGLMGPRGVGKTTLVLQHIKEQLPRKDSLYVQAEDFYFACHRLTELADSFAKMGGKYLFIDEIHKYKDWARELKLITVSPISDFLIDGKYTFKVGGKKKKQNQLQNIENGYVV